MARTQDEIREDLAYIKAEIEALDASETRSEDDDTRYGEGLDLFERLTEELAVVEARDEKRAKVAEFAAKPANRVGPTLLKSESRDVFDLSEIRGLAPDARGVEMRGRAMEMAETAPSYVSDEARESITRLCDGSIEVREQRPGSIAEHLIVHGSPAYADAFGRYLKNPEDYEARAALNITTTTQGQFTLPTHLDPTVIRTDTGNINPLREISRVVTVDTAVWNGLSSAGVTASFTTESAVVGDNSPTFAQPSITPRKAHAYVQATGEFLEDSALSVAAEVGAMFAISKANLEATKFAVGSTATTEPNGIVTALQQTTASRIDAQTNGSFWAGDVMALQSGTPARWRPNGSWLAETSIYNLVRQFNIGAAGQGGSVFWTDLGGGRPGQLLGRPAYESSAMQASPLASGFTATASSDDILVYGDFNEFAIVDRVGATVQFNPMVVDPTTGRPIDNVGWYFRWRVGAGCLVANAFRLLRV